MALRAVMAAARAPEDAAGRIGQAEGVGCTLTAVEGVVGRVDGVRWSVLVPGRRILFHPPDRAVAARRVPAGRQPAPAEVAVLVEAAR
ncbi:hypothetical protein SHJG_1576 [Streptomyces hygroscopicus subsp. jinggangensis 5008]|nr:hypothetical protein SHJG_1576 [Streptomyces hygroscopicus subsp. jinggangensis 5008]